MGALKPWHIAIFVVVLVLLFGAKRLPDAARSLGRSLRIIKAETKGLIDENNDVAEKAEPQHSRQPIQGEVLHQQPQTPPPPPGGYQQPAAQPQAQPQQQPYVDPVQRTHDR